MGRGGGSFVGAPARWWPAVVIAASLVGCDCRRDASSDVEASAEAPPPWKMAEPPPPARPGMVWVPAGVLIAGTPPGQLPRVADAEMPGVAIELKGFFIDQYNYPAEPGAIPRTGLTQAKAREICLQQDKRLCTELEWERACKGPNNLTYEYGATYDPQACATGGTEALAPNGVNATCESGFGVRDLHGTAANWTSSAWGRGTGDGKVTVRGGNGTDGELVGRCAHGMGLDPKAEDPRVGVRCCAGEANAASVALDISKGNALAYRPFDPRLARRLESLLPDEVKQLTAARPKADQFEVERLWMWRPIGNEELIIGGGCAHPPVHDACGVMVARLIGDTATPLAFVASDWWIPTVGAHEEPRSLYIYGGDRAGAFRKPFVYEWGRIGEGKKQRKRGGGWSPSSY